MKRLALIASLILYLSVSILVIYQTTRASTSYRVYLPFVSKLDVSGIFNFHMGRSCDDWSCTVFPLPTHCVYVIFNHHDLRGIEVRIEIYDDENNALFVQTKDYWGTGKECIEVCLPEPPYFAPGIYVTNRYDNGLLVYTIIWEVSITRPW